MRIAPLLLLVLAWSGSAQAGEQSPLEAQQQADQRLLDIGWRLMRGSAAYCPDAPAATGMVLRDVRAYRDPDAVRSEFGQAGDIAIQAVAAGSPAAEAGIRPGAEIASLQGADPNVAPARERRDWERLHRIRAGLDLALRQYGAIGLARVGEREFRLDGVPACYARFEIVGDKDQAASEGGRIRIGERWLRDSVSDEHLAALLAHELAHNILKHRLRRDLPRGERPSAKDVEREADRLTPWLLLNAGFDPAAAESFLETYGPGQDGFLFIDFEHDGWKTRRDLVREELAIIDARQGPLDWRERFAAETAAALAVMPAR